MSEVELWRANVARTRPNLVDRMLGRNPGRAIHRHDARPERVAPLDLEALTFEEADALDAALADLNTRRGWGPYRHDETVWLDGAKHATQAAGMLRSRYEARP